MILNLVLCAFGCFLLYICAEWLVKGASGLARSLGITPLMIGLTVVAFGTSAPELVVSLVSAIKGKSMIAVGNVVGSNICNIALVLGLSAMFQPITCQRSVMKRDIPIMLGVSGLLFVFSVNATIGTLEGVVLFTGVILYIIISYRLARMEAELQMPVASVVAESGRLKVSPRTKQIVLIVAGISGVIYGAQLVVDAATKIMLVLGVNEKFIGLTIVAFGTSLPELATSVVAAIRREMDISFGNIVGSNVFNILSVIGATAIVRPIHLPGGFWESGLAIDYAVMVAISFLPWVLMRKTLTINRTGGMLLLACYAGYFAYLVAVSFQL